MQYSLMASKSQTCVFSLIGRVGSGKSATCNTILGKNNFTSTRLIGSVTKKTQWGRSPRKMDAFVVIDTPGLFDTNDQSSKKHILNEIGKSVGMAMTFSNGIDAFIIILNADELLTEENVQSVKVLRGLLGEDMMKFSILLFTRRDLLEYEGVTLDEFLETAPTFLRNVIKGSSNRLIAFDNQNMSDEKQIADLIDMVKQITRMHGSVPHTDELTSKVKTIVTDDKKSHKQDAKYGAVASKSQTYVITLVGTTGSGKSATGNTILGENKFESKRVMQSVTKKTEWGRSFQKTGEFVVIDTPGLFDTEGQSREKYILNKICKSVGIAMTQSDGIDAFIIVLNADGRLTEENIKSLKFLRRLFGEDMMKYSIVLFTRRDQLEEENVTLDKFLKTIPPFFRNLIKDCSDRVIAFNNKNKDDEKQVADLIDMVTQIKRKNGFVPYINDLFSKVRPIVNDDKKKYKQDAKYGGAVASKSQTYVITLVGRTGSGKSATGNTILGENKFESKRVMQSVTKKTAWGRSTRKTSEFVVIDTPGLFDTEGQSREKYILKEIGKSVGIAMTYCNGIDAFIIVLNADERLTKEGLQSLKFLRGLFGEDMMKYSIVLFTRRDQLEEENVTLDKFLKTTPKFLRNVIKDCSKRVLAFNNKNKDDEKQVEDLIDMVKQIKRKNGFVPYTNKVLSEVKSIIDDDKKSYKQDANDSGDADHQADRLMNDESNILHKITSVIGGLVRSFLRLFRKDQI